MNPVSMRLLGQQLICPQFSAPHDAVAWMGAVQGQDYRGMRWAVAMRTRRPSAKAFEQEFNEGRIIRAHLFRNTWQLVAAEDYRWMVDLCSGKARSGIKGWMRQLGYSVSEDDELRFREFLSQAMCGKGSLSRAEIEALVQDSPLRMERERIKYMLILAEVAGTVCSGVLTPKERSYMLVDERIPAQPSLCREEALAELARRYFRSHSPASLEDFVWWSGLNTGQCRQGMESIGAELTQERWRGLVFHLHRDCRTRGFRSGCVHLLPAYDEYLIGYKSRQVALRPEHRHHAHDQKGIFWPVVLQDGEVVGNWSASGNGIRTELFRDDVSLNSESLSAQSARYLKFLEK